MFIGTRKDLEMINDYIQQIIQFAYNDTVMFVVMVFASLLLLFLLIMLLCKPKKHEPPVKIQEKKPTAVLTAQDIRAIAGDDVMITQLDLARAYIELGKIKLAKQILNNVLTKGDDDQQQAAQQLLSTL